MRPAKPVDLSVVRVSLWRELVALISCSKSAVY